MEEPPQTEERSKPRSQGKEEREVHDLTKDSPKPIFELQRNLELLQVYVKRENRVTCNSEDPVIQAKALKEAMALKTSRAREMAEARRNRKRKVETTGRSLRSSKR
jgi:hypothetical protein